MSEMTAKELQAMSLENMATVGTFEKIDDRLFWRGVQTQIALAVHCQAGTPLDLHAAQDVPRSGGQDVAGACVRLDGAGNIRRDTQQRGHRRDVPPAPGYRQRGDHGGHGPPGVHPAPEPTRRHAGQGLGNRGHAAGYGDLQKFRQDGHQRNHAGVDETMANFRAVGIRRRGQSESGHRAKRGGRQSFQRFQRLTSPAFGRICFGRVRLEQLQDFRRAGKSDVGTGGYRFRDLAFADLPELTEANLGLVVNVTGKFTTTDSFLDGSGAQYPAGTNVVVVKSGEEYKYDVLAGFVDLSGYASTEAVDAAKTAAITQANTDTDAKLYFHKLTPMPPAAPPRPSRCSILSRPHLCQSTADWCFQAQCLRQRMHVKTTDIQEITEADIIAMFAED